MVSISKMYPEDTIKWHADMCYAIKTGHDGESDACVVYIAATPTMKQNLSYVKRQMQNIMERLMLGDFRNGRKARRLAWEKGF